MASPASLAQICFVLVILYLTQAEAVGYCPSHCDSRGAYHPAIHCHYPPAVYCCGSPDRMLCCADKSLDITGYYPERFNCPENTWFQIHWQVMITMSGTILLVMLFSACCCQCCRICADKAREREHHIRFHSDAQDTGTTIVTDADGNQLFAEPGQAEGGDNGRVTIQMFNPESPFAFTPPEYATLAKDPPKYSEVFGADGGNMNPCYVPDTPPPTFSEAVATNESSPMSNPLGGNDPTLESSVTDDVPTANATLPPVSDTDQTVETQQETMNGEVQPLNQESEFVEVDLSQDNDQINTQEGECEALRHPSSGAANESRDNNNCSEA